MSLLMTMLNCLCSSKAYGMLKELEQISVPEWGTELSWLRDRLNLILSCFMRIVVLLIMSVTSECSASKLLMLGKVADSMLLIVRSNLIQSSASALARFASNRSSLFS